MEISRHTPPRRMRPIGLAGRCARPLLALATALTMLGGAAPAIADTVATTGLPRHTPVPGGVALIELPTGTTDARFGGLPVLIRDGRAIVGLALTTTPGIQVLELDGGKKLEFSVADKTYPVQHVRIKDQGKVDLSDENLQRVAREHAEIKALKHQFNRGTTPDTQFVAPADGPKSGRFGARRIFNDQPRAPHVGLDFAVPLGAPIKSAAAGTVLATGDYFFNGKTVYVDHGQGLISMYCHLDAIAVAVGQPVTRAQRLGSAGATGRASGPHLHWSVILNGAMVDPEVFLPVEDLSPATKKSAPASP